MKIPVVGFDPSLRNWGIAESYLDLTTGELDTPRLSLIQPKDQKGKQVRQNSIDLALAESLSLGAMAAARRAKIIFVECPHGSQSARAMASYGICIGILGAIRAEGIPLIEISALENKVVFTGNRNATKEEMIQRAISLYPEANFPRFKNKITDNAEHVADAIAAIHAGVRTPVFQNLMRILQGNINQ